MKSACPSAERLVGPLGPKSTGRESLFPERWATVWRLILKEPQGQVHPRAVTVLREAGVHPPTWLGRTCPHREPRWSQPRFRQRYWEWRGRCPREISLLLPRQREWILCGYKTTYVHFNHVGFIIDDHSWLSRWRNFGKRKVRHPTPLPVFSENPAASGISAACTDLSSPLIQFSTHLSSMSTCQALCKVPHSKLFTLH